MVASGPAAIADHQDLAPDVGDPQLHGHGAGRAPLGRVRVAEHVEIDAWLVGHIITRDQPELGLLWALEDLDLARRQTLEVARAIECVCDLDDDRGQHELPARVHRGPQAP